MDDLSTSPRKGEAIDPLRRQTGKLKGLSFSKNRPSYAQRWLGPRFTGWRVGVLHFAIWTLLVFLLNLCLTIVGSRASGDNKGVILEKDCAEIKRLNTGLHVLINILGTILLSGSNYCMQCLSAPTREEIDKAHGNVKRRWLDIGVPSIRNVRYIKVRRMILWLLLGLSSVPLHLLYNSAVFSSISSNSYWVFSVSESFIEASECLNCGNFPDERRGAGRRADNGPGPHLDSQETRPRPVSEIPEALDLLWKKARAGDLDNLTASECLNDYAQIIQSNRRNLLLVARDAEFPPPDTNFYVNGSYVYWGDKFSSGSATGATNAASAYSWICSGISMTPEVTVSSTPCSVSVSQFQGNISSWRPGWWCPPDEGFKWSDCQYASWPVEYCLSEKAEQHCKLHFEPTIAVVVTVLNLLKAGLMFLVAFWLSDQPIMNIGDAVASFLRRNDPFTKNMCLSSIKDLKKQGYSAGPREWNNRRYRWKDVTSKTRRLTVLLLFFISITGVATVFGFALASLTVNVSIIDLGFGRVDPRTSISTWLPDDVLVKAVIANIPQLILSVLYFNYNALFTAMLMGYEWTSYAVKRKGLRVSHDARGAQRTTYFLQLPYRFGVPLMVLAGTLHWLVSQSIFVVVVEYYDSWGGRGPGYFEWPKWKDEKDLQTLGFSLAPMIAVMVLGGLMVISIVAAGYVPYHRGMPVAGSSSMAISAACQDGNVEMEGYEGGVVGEQGSVAAEEKVQWGVVSTSSDGVGHCAFSSEHVEAPVEGRVYAGVGMGRRLG